MPNSLQPKWSLIRGLVIDIIPEEEKLLRARVVDDIDGGER